MRITFILTLVAALFGGAHRSHADCQFGPDFCQDDPRIAPLLAAKKKALQKDYPERLVSLLDIGSQCVARIERSPDVFTMWVVNADNSKETVLWSQDNEDTSIANIAVGGIKRFWIYNGKQAFACGGEKKPEDRSDWNAEDDINTETAILCDENGCTK